MYFIVLTYILGFGSSVLARIWLTIYRSPKYKVLKSIGNNQIIFYTNAEFGNILQAYCINNFPKENKMVIRYNDGIIKCHHYSSDVFKNFHLINLEQYNKITAKEKRKGSYKENLLIMLDNYLINEDYVNAAKIRDIIMELDSSGGNKQNK